MEYELHLNFLAADGPIPPFRIFRRARRDDEAIPRNSNWFGGRFAEGDAETPEWRSFVISLDPADGFEPFVAPSDASVSLTRRVLFHALIARCSELRNELESRAYSDGFLPEVVFPLRKYPEGEEEIILQPYHLAATGQFGFLVDFHFRLGKGVTFSRRVQQLSLSLDARFRRNLDYYAQRLEKIQGFIARRWSQLTPLRLPGATSSLPFSSDLTRLPAGTLKSKSYIVGAGEDRKETRSQYNGLKEVGPWENVTRCPPLLFVFRKQEIESARRLARALRGREQGITFAGFEALFRLPLEISSDPVVVRDFSKASMEKALERVVSKDGPTHLPVLVMPKSEDAYAVHKAVFAHAGVPTQVCTTEVLADDSALQWSIANIALQIFCKVGGKPWRVKPTSEGALVIGISQSHKLTGGTDRRVERYFAFSILTDSSGLFQSINVIGDDPDQESYLEQLRKNLERLLRDNASRYNKVVLHTSFKLKHAEILIIHDVVKEAAKTSSGCQFAVVKINQRNRFFAVNRSVNSYVPYEGSYMDLGHGEYLLWFEGITLEQPSVKKVIPGPTHLSFLKVSDKQLIGDDQILQDLVNLSGANWRGFNAKSTPVSVFFCHLVADRIREFQERNLPLPAIHEIKPWFL